jgi:hypothetical protein
MRSSIIALGLAAVLTPAIVAAQGAPPPATVDPNAATAPPPAYAPPPGQPTYAPPPPQTYAPPPPMAVAEPVGAPSLKGLSAWGILPWGGIGVGARFMMPVGIAPLLRGSGVRDSWALEFGADFMHFSYGYLTSDYSYNQVVPVIGLMWKIWLNQQFALYPKLEAGYAIGWWSDWNSTYGTQPNHGWLFWDVTAGLLYKLNSGLTLRAEGGYAGLKLGVGWLF